MTERKRRIIRGCHWSGKIEVWWIFHESHSSFVQTVLSHNTRETNCTLPAYYNPYENIYKFAWQKYLQHFMLCYYASFLFFFFLCPLLAQLFSLRVKGLATLKSHTHIICTVYRVASSPKSIRTHAVSPNTSTGNEFATVRTLFQ